MDAVLARFSKRKKAALDGCIDFVTTGFNQGRREELRGGGLIRSSGGITELFARNPEELEPSNERILGGGDFVKSVLLENDNYDNKWRASIDDVLKEVATRQGISCEQILGASRSRYGTSAFSEFFLYGVHNLN